MAWSWVRAAFYFAATCLLAGGAAAQEDLIGSWNGTYTCSGMSATMTLDVEEGPVEGLYIGVFSFEAPQGSGSYRVFGQLASDGKFTFAPGDWIDRPSGFTPVAIEGTLHPNGLRIEGRPSPCVLGSLLATRDLANVERPDAIVTPVPLSGGAAAGHWSGHVSCAQNRRGITELYPIDLSLWQDGDGVAGIATLDIYKVRGTGTGEAYHQTVLMQGSLIGDQLALENSLLIDKGGAPVDLRRINATLSGDALDGPVRLQTCETISLAHVGAAPFHAIPEADFLADLWLGAGGRQDDTSVMLVSGGDEMSPYFEVRTATPMSRPEALRQSVAMVLMPLHVYEHGVIAVPISRREPSGDARVASGITVENARAVALMPQDDGTVTMVSIERQNMFDIALRGAEIRDAMRVVSLARPSEALAEAVVAGEMPPIEFGGRIGGALATAPSREAQCRVLDDWITPHAVGLDIDRASVDVLRAGLVGAFADEVFIPVFGVPLVFTTSDERLQLRSLMTGTCKQGQQMRMVGVVGDHILSSDAMFNRYTALIADQAETARWQDGFENQLAALSDDESGLQGIVALRQDYAGRRNQLSNDARTTLLSAIDQREREIQGAILLAEAHGLAADGFDTGALDRVFSIMNRVASANIERSMSAEITRVAEAKATQILAPALTEAAQQAQAAPQSLEGLAEVMRIYNGLRPARAGMERYFGSLDRGGALAPMTERLNAFWSDASIRDAVRDRLLAIEAGMNYQSAIENAAALYVDLDALDRAPGYRELIAEAIATGEVRSIRISDRSAQTDPNEPTAEEIARFALDRVRSANEAIAAEEALCLSGQVSDSFTALRCLTNPATLAGQGGLRARLHAVTKITCIPEVAETHYICTFTQEVDFVFPGGAAFGIDAMADHVRGLSSREASDARFIRSNTGGWTVVWGDLN